MACWEMNKKKLELASKNAEKSVEELKQELREAEREKGHDYAENLFEFYAKGEIYTKKKKKGISVAYA